MKNEAAIEGVIVAGQPTDAELSRLPERGITTLVNLRPHHELPEPQAPKVPSGVTYVEVPFDGTTIGREHVEGVRAALDAAGGPAAVHCAGGTRAAVMVAIIASERAGEGASGALRRIADAGFDVAGTPYAAFVAGYFRSGGPV
jgi:uncharacterized protein (TIGR01244 family)